jgi:hypothetical protein
MTHTETPQIKTRRFGRGGAFFETDDGTIVTQFFDVDCIGGASLNLRLSDDAANLDNIAKLMATYRAECARGDWEPSGDPTTAEAFLIRTKGRGVLHLRPKRANPGGRAQALRHIDNLYGLHTDTGKILLLDLIDHMGADALTDAALIALASLHIAKDQA